MFIFSLTLWTAIYFLIGFESTELVKTIFYAWLIMAVNTLVGYIVFEKAYGSDNSTFNVYVLGGLSVRLIFIMILVGFIVIMKWLMVKEFLLSMFVFYVVYVVLEILGYQKKNQFEKKILKTNEKISSN
jgi:hypothetical protein